MTKPISEWKDDCLHAAPIKLHDKGPVINLECCKGRPNCRKKPGMDDKYFDDEGICNLYAESYSHKGDKCK